MHNVLIDMETKHCKTFMRAIARLKSTADVTYGGMYREDNNFSQVHYTGEMNADQIDAWAYKVKAGNGFIGAIDKGE